MSQRQRDEELNAEHSQRDDRLHVVIVGAGFGGLQLAETLSRSKEIRITLIDRQNFHLFQPLLYQVATGGLSPANIATSLRSILGSRKNVEILLGEVIDFDVNRKVVKLVDGEVTYQKLVVAAGATHSYFGNDHWAKFAPGLKTIADATEIRRRIFLAFEAAERTHDEDVQREWLTFVVVGGGPTGVELAALAEIARSTLRSDFRHIRPETARIMLVEAGDSVLDSFPEKLRMRALESLKKRGIQIELGTCVSDIKLRQVALKRGEETEWLSTRTVLWAAGVTANPLGAKLAKACGQEAVRGGRVRVDQHLRLQDRTDEFVIGDLAYCLDENEQPLPGLAPVAMQQGKYLAKYLRNGHRGPVSVKPFCYKNPGTMATIGRTSAVAHVGNRKFAGVFAWLLWLFVHLMMLVKFQNRLLVLTQWAWNYLTFNRSAWLITGLSSPLTVVSEESDESDEVESSEREFEEAKSN